MNSKSGCRRRVGQYFRLTLFWLVVAPLIAACADSDEWKPAHSGEIFRYTAVGNSSALDSIILGQPWKTAEKYGAHPGDTLTALPNGTFGGADAIGVHRDTAGVVSEIDFYYHGSRDIDALVSDYRKSLGAPPAVTTDTVEGSVRKTTRWEDANTEFVVATIQPPDKDGIGAVAFLRDRSARRLGR